MFPSPKDPSFWLCFWLSPHRGRGFLAHRSVLDGLLCRARARLKMGDATGARADATTACGMAGLMIRFC